MRNSLDNCRQNFFLPLNICNTARFGHMKTPCMQGDADSIRNIQRVLATLCDKASIYGYRICFATYWIPHIMQTCSYQAYAILGDWAGTCVNNSRCIHVILCMWWAFVLPSAIANKLLYALAAFIDSDEVHCYVGRLSYDHAFDTMLCLMPSGKQTSGFKFTSQVQSEVRYF